MKVPVEDQFIDCTLVRFCAGPCDSILTEATVPGFERIFLKPWPPNHRYTSLTYDLNNGTAIILKNFRMCSGCVKRMLKLQQNCKHVDKTVQKQAHTQMHADGMAVRYKLFQYASFERVDPPVSSEHVNLPIAE